MRNYIVLLFLFLFVALSIGFVLPFLVSAKSDLALGAAAAWALMLMPAVIRYGWKLYKKPIQSKEVEQ